MSTSSTRVASIKLSRRDRFTLFLEHEGNRRLRSLGTALYRLTSGRFTPRSRDVLLLTTRGRKSGRQHTVILQGFRDGTSLVLAAVNAGRTSDPDWFCNLGVSPEATVELKGRTFRARAERLSAEETERWWPQILHRAPSYDLFLKASKRTIPLVRLVPMELDRKALS
jgi:F420H(2)-dependent quinone reductase